MVSGPSAMLDAMTAVTQRARDVSDAAFCRESQQLFLRWPHGVFPIVFSTPHVVVGPARRPQVAATLAGTTLCHHPRAHDRRATASRVEDDPPDRPPRQPLLPRRGRLRQAGNITRQHKVTRALSKSTSTPGSHYHAGLCSALGAAVRSTVRN